MNIRSDNMKSDRFDKSSNSSRRNKKKYGKKLNPINDNWCGNNVNVNNNNNNKDDNINNGHKSGGSSSSGGVGLDYGQMFWQQASGIPPHMQQHTGQRLFTAMSDPSVCGYSAMPMAYTMEPISMPPLYPIYRPVPQQQQHPQHQQQRQRQQNYNKSYKDKTRRNILHNHQYIIANQHQTSMSNGYSSLQDNTSNYLIPRYCENGDYTSLPPSANDNIDDSDELNSEHRRYSDPGLGPADINNYDNSDDSDTGESETSIVTIGKNNKLVFSLIEQMTNLREANSRMFKELHETKLSLDNVKAELSKLKNQTSSDYQPGMLSDIISEMRDASRSLDESLMTKVTSIIEDKNQQTQLEMKDIKERLVKLNEEKYQNSNKIIKLEEEISRLKINSKRGMEEEEKMIYQTGEHGGHHA